MENEQIDAKENLRWLAKRLREPLPTGFEWEFRVFSMLDDSGKYCGCAVGLVEFERLHGERFTTIVEKFLGLNKDNVEYMIFDPDVYLADDRTDVDILNIYGVKDHSLVTPQMVARKIEQWLETSTISHEEAQHLGYSE